MFTLLALRNEGSLEGFASHLFFPSASLRDPSAAAPLTNRSPHLHPLNLNRCHPACVVDHEGPRERSRSERSEGSSFRFPPRRALNVSAFHPLSFPFDLKLSTLNCFSLNFFRMNTCESVSKQRTLTPFRMNTCEKGGRGCPIIVNLNLALSGRPARGEAPSLSSRRACLSVADRPALSMVEGACPERGRRVDLQPFLLTTPYPPLTFYPLKPLPHMAHPYLCTRKNGPAAREPRYSPCAAS